MRGFNPLARLPGGSDEAQLGRWRGWLAGLGVKPEGLDLLACARGEGVKTVPELCRWFEQEVRLSAGRPARQALAVLQKRLAPPLVREWLDWPEPLWRALNVN